MSKILNGYDFGLRLILVFKLQQKVIHKILTVMSIYVLHVHISNDIVRKRPSVDSVNNKSALSRMDNEFDCEKI